MRVRAASRWLRAALSNTILVEAADAYLSGTQRSALASIRRGEGCVGAAAAASPRTTGIAGCGRECADEDVISATSPDDRRFMYGPCSRRTSTRAAWGSAGLSAKTGGWSLGSAGAVRFGISCGARIGVSAYRVKSNVFRTVARTGGTSTGALARRR